MARRRLNLKLLIILSCGLVGIGMFLAAFWYFANSARATAALRAADAAADAGNFDRAAERYARALRHQDYAQDLEVILKASSAHAGIIVTERRTAWKELSHMVNYLRLGVRINPRDGRPLQRLMDFNINLGRRFGQATVWDDMYQACEELIRNYGDLIQIRKYRGISQVYRMGMAATNLTVDEREQAAQDLRDALSYFEDDADCLERLAVWNVLQAELLDRPGADVARAATLRDDAARMTAEAFERHPEELRRLNDHVKVLLHIERKDEAALHLQTMQELIASRSGSDFDIADALQLVISVQMQAGKLEQEQIRPVLERAAVLLEDMLQQHSDGHSLKLALARINEHIRQHDKAMEIYAELADLPLEAAPLELVSRFQTKTVASLALLKLRMRRIRAERDAAQREAALIEIERDLSALKEQIGDVPAIKEVAGSISALRGEWGKASREFEDLTTRFAGDVSTLVQAAESRMRLGEWGAAAEQYEQIIRVRPDLLAVRDRLARIYVRGRIFDKAERHIRMLAQHDEHKPRAMALQLEWLVRQRRFDESDQLLRQLPVADSAELTVLIAGLYAEAGRTDAARNLLDAAFEKHLDNIMLVSWLLRIVPDRSARIEYLRRCHDAGGDKEKLETMRQYVDGELKLQDKVAQRQQQVLGQVHGRGIEAIKTYRERISEGDVAGADTALDKVSDDNDAYVLAVWNLFLQALQQKDWATAEKMVARARSTHGGMGADLAGGLFYLGQLESHRGRFEQAADHFRKALGQRKVYSKGWQMLGETLLQLKEIDEALDAFQRAASQRPDNVAALVGLAKAHDMQGKNRDALKSMRTAFKYQPNNGTIAHAYLDYELEHGKADIALALRQRIAKEQPKNLANRRALVLTLMKVHRRVDAMKVLQVLIDETGETLPNILVTSQAIAKTHDLATAASLLVSHMRKLGAQATEEQYTVVARQLMALNRRDEALSAYRQAIAKKGPSSRAAQAELAAVLVQQPGGAAEATRLYDELHREDPKNRAICRAYVHTLTTTGALDEADRVLEHLVGITGQDVPAIMLRASIEAGRGNLDEALSACDTAIEMAPKRPELHRTKAQLMLLDPSRTGEALQVLDKTLEMAPQMVDARRLRARVYAVQGEVGTSIREYEGLIEKHPDDVQGRLELAQLYLNDGQTRQLRTLLRESAKRFPTSAVWPRKLAEIERRKNQPEKAIALFQKAMQLEPVQNSLLKLTLMQVEAQKPEAALEAMQKHVSLVKGSARLLAVRGRALFLLKKQKEARIWFAQALKAADGTQELRIVCGQITKVLERPVAAAMVLEVFGDEIATGGRIIVADMLRIDHKLDPALGRLEPMAADVEDMTPSDRFYFYQTYAVTLHEAAHFEKAEQIYRILLELEPRNPAIMNNLAHVLSEGFDRTLDAIAMAEQALELWPDNHLILDTLGWAHYRQGQLDEAEKMLEESYRRKQTAAICYHLAEVMIDRERPMRAIELLTAGRELAEESKDKPVLELITKRLDSLNEERASSSE